MPVTYIIHGKDQAWCDVENSGFKAIVVVKGDAERAIRFSSNWLHLDPSSLAAHEIGKEEALLFARDRHACDLPVPTGYEDWDCLE